MMNDFHNTPERRYNNDNHFKALVDMMHAQIINYNFTPSEMREAAILASILHERMLFRKIYVPEVPKVVKECLDALHKAHAICHVSMKITKKKTKAKKGHKGGADVYN